MRTKQEIITKFAELARQWEESWKYMEIERLEAQMQILKWVLNED